MISTETKAEQISRPHVIKITNYERLEMLPLTEKENKSYYKKKFVTYWKKWI